MLLIPELQNFPQEQIGSLVLSDLHAPPEGIVLAGVNSQALLEVNMVHEKVRASLSLNYIDLTKKSQQGSVV